MTTLVGYLLVFLVVGVVFVFFHLMLGKLVRPARPDPEKLTIYECGEPTIGSAWIQFDLRFYVVALLFVIFDVEVAFFFPWGVVFGKANAVAQQTSPPETPEERQVYNENIRALVPRHAMNARERALYLNDDNPPELTQEDIDKNAAAARKLGWIAFFDIVVFFGVLLVGFAYLWKRGDLAWVRALVVSGAKPPPTEPPLSVPVRGEQQT